jgi:hypothetical protein
MPRVYLAREMHLTATRQFVRHPPQPGWPANPAACLGRLSGPPVWAACLGGPSGPLVWRAPLAVGCRCVSYPGSVRKRLAALTTACKEASRMLESIPTPQATFPGSGPDDPASTYATEDAPLPAVMACWW